MRIFTFLFFTFLFFQGCREKVTIPKESTSVVDLDSIDQKINPLFLEKETEFIQELYKHFEYKIIWSDVKNRLTLIDFIAKSKEDGLFPEDYHFKEINFYEKNRTKLNYSNFQAYDIILSNAFKNLADHLHKGKLNPRELYNDWDLPNKKPIAVESLIKAIENNEINDLLIDVSVKNSIYANLKKGLISILEKPAYDFKKTIVETKIVSNDSSETIKIIKQKLFYWGDLKTENYSLKYDTESVNAVKNFQRRNGLIPDGVIGKGTAEVLNLSKEKLIEKFQVNLERWKWFPDDLGENYILINIPNYKLDFIFEKDTIASKRIVVGKPSRKTPILSSNISNIVFNPTWTVPPTILKEDLVPTASKNLNYFSKNKITILDSKKDTVQPKDWNSKNYKKYKYVQKSGSDNSLGLVKFNFPNKHMVYLHDTNHRDYFAHSFRALSSGCIRLEEPLLFAKTILMEEDEEKWKASEIDTIIKKAKIEVIPIKTSIRIHLLYYTSWVEDNMAQYRTDIYKYDDELYEKLRNASVAKG